MIHEQIKNDLAILENRLEHIRQKKPHFLNHVRIRQIEGDIGRLKTTLAEKEISQVSMSPSLKATHNPTTREKNSLKTVFYTFCSKKGRKNNPGLNQSLFSLHYLDGSSAAKFTVESNPNKQYLSGGFAQRVKKGFVESDPEPRYAVKIFKKNLFKGRTHHELRIAMRASYCAQLLGRTGLAFRRHGKQYFVTDWHQGIALSSLELQINTWPIAQRLNLAIDLTRQLATLHNKKLIHGDIKPQNIIISPNSVHLIDLDGVLLKGETPLIGLACTTAFLDAQLNWDLKHDANAYKSFDEKSDLYALGLTLAYLFPDLLVPTYCIKRVPVSGSNHPLFEYNSVALSYGNQWQQHKELVNFIFMLISPNKNYRPETASIFLNVLTRLYSYKYAQFPDNSQYQPNQTEPSASETFADIEKNLLKFNHKLSIWKKNEAQLSRKQCIKNQPLVDIPSPVIGSGL
ncbi:MAG: protein kinase [bacterium]|nr:protein kinase [bacterium]